MKSFIFQAVFISVFVLGFASAQGQPVKKVQTYYQKYDSLGLAAPLKEEYFVLENDTLRHGPYKKFSPEGEVLLSGVFHYGKKDSTFTEYYEGGLPKSIIPYKEDKIEGEASYYSIKGDLQYKEIYTPTAEPDKEGSYRKLTRDNKLLAQGFLKNGLLDSMLTEYYDNGSVKLKSTYRNGKLEGKTFIYNKEGKLLQELEYAGGKIDGNIVTYYPGGNIKNSAVYKDGELNGILNEYFSNGKLKSETVYKNNLPNGGSRTYYEDGKLKTEEFYINGILNGFFKTYYPEGGVNTESTIINDKKNGIFKSYNRKGTLVLEGGYKDGVLEGENKAYYDDGSLKHRFNYRNGKKTGKNVALHPNGKTAREEIIKEDEKGTWIKVRSYYESGNTEQISEFFQPVSVKEKSSEENLRIGEWESYYDNKQPKSKEFYQNDKLHGERLLYNEDGSLSEKQIYSNGIKTGIWYTYYPDGTVKSETSYKNSALYGPYKSYFSNGKPEVSGHYINGRQNANWQYFNDSGKLLKTLTYKNGKLVKEKIH